MNGALLRPCRCDVGCLNAVTPLSASAFQCLLQGRCRTVETRLFGLAACEVLLAACPAPRRTLPPDLKKIMPTEQPQPVLRSMMRLAGPRVTQRCARPGSPPGPAALHAVLRCRVGLHAPYATPRPEPPRAPRRQARAKELRQELLNSARLAAHFEEHPGDLALLKHDRPLAKAAAPAHLRHLPAYLRAQTAGGGAGAGAAGSAGRGALAPPPGCAGSDVCGCAWQRVTSGRAEAAPLPRARLGAVAVALSLCCALLCGIKGRCAGAHASSHHVQQWALVPDSYHAGEGELARVETRAANIHLSLS